MPNVIPDTWLCGRRDQGFYPVSRPENAAGSGYYRAVIVSPQTEFAPTPQL